MKFDAKSSKNGSLELSVFNILQIHVKRYPPETVFEIGIKRLKKTKSDPMRRYYFGFVLPPLMEASGYDVDEKALVHHNLKGKYFECKIDPRLNTYVGVPSVFGNESRLQIDEKWEFVEWVIRFATRPPEEGGFGCKIPDPTER